MDRPQKITFGEMRASGVRDGLIYARSSLLPPRRNERRGWGDDVRLSTSRTGLSVRSAAAAVRRAAEVSQVEGQVRLASTVCAMFGKRPINQVCKFVPVCLPFWTQIRPRLS